VKLRWTRHAIADREEILGYLAERSPRVAVLLDERVEHQLALLRDFP
jgi:plasmid stabilization system protein ParE